MSLSVHFHSYLCYISDKIDREELKEILKSTDMYGCDVHLDDHYIDDTLSMGDTNGDGKLDIDGTVTGREDILDGWTGTFTSYIWN